MKIYRVVVGPIQENCYIIKNDENNEGIIVDPGDEGDRIMEAVKKAEITKIAAIFITHGHGDHVSALDEVKKATGAPVYMSEADAPMLRVWNSSLSYSTDRNKSFDPRIIILRTRKNSLWPGWISDCGHAGPYPGRCLHHYGRGGLCRGHHLPGIHRPDGPARGFLRCPAEFHPYQAADPAR